MPPTLASVVRSSSLHLTVLAGADQLERPVRWVHTSELDDPTPFLEGGELLLTTGIKLGKAAAKLQAYVHRLADAGVVGLGLGVGLSHTEVPQALVDAAAQRGLPLIRVPEATPFIAISKTVSAALAAEQYEAVTTSFEAQEELTRAALGKDGTTAVVQPSWPPGSAAGPRCTTAPARSPPSPPTGPPGARADWPPRWTGCAAARHRPRPRCRGGHRGSTPPTRTTWWSSRSARTAYRAASWRSAPRTGSPPPSGTC